MKPWFTQFNHRWRSRLLPVALAVAGCQQQTPLGTGFSPDGSTAQPCSNDSQPFGVDVSEYQGQIDWAAVRSAGVVFAAARIGNGTHVLDKRFDENWQGMKANGIVRVAYHFWRYWADQDAQADIVAQKVGRLGPGDLGVEVDLEEESFWKPGTKTPTYPSPNEAMQQLRRFVARIEADSGKPALFYTRQNFWDLHFGSPEYGDRLVWVADYRAARCPLPPIGWPMWNFHQYSSAGRVAGINANVDINRFNGSEATLRALAASDATNPTPPIPPVSSIKFDSRTFVSLGGELVESITAYGRYWNFVGDTIWKDSNGLPLGSVARYAQGPCAGHANDCTFDSRTFVELGGQLVESITAYGKYWNFVDDTIWKGGDGGPLASVARYASGPCAGHANDCSFDSTPSLSSMDNWWNRLPPMVSIGISSVRMPGRSHRTACSPTCRVMRRSVRSRPPGRPAPLTRAPS